MTCLGEDRKLPRLATPHFTDRQLRPLVSLKLGTRRGRSSSCEPPGPWSPARGDRHPGAAQRGSFAHVLSHAHPELSKGGPRRPNVKGLGEAPLRQDQGDGGVKMPPKRSGSFLPEGKPAYAFAPDHGPGDLRGGNDCDEDRGPAVSACPARAVPVHRANTHQGMGELMQVGEDLEHSIAGQEQSSTPSQAARAPPAPRLLSIARIEMRSAFPRARPSRPRERRCRHRRAARFLAHARNANKVPLDSVVGRDARDPPRSQDVEAECMTSPFWTSSPCLEPAQHLLAGGRSLPRRSALPADDLR